MRKNFLGFKGQPKLKRGEERIVGQYAEHNLFSDKLVSKPGEEEQLLDLHGQTASTILPTYEALEVEAVKDLEYYGYEAYLAADVRKANVLFRVYRAEYRNPDTGITGGRFGVIAYVKDRTGKYWVTKDCARKITIAKFMPNIEVPYSVSRGQNKVMIPADYKDFYIVVNKAAK